MDQQNAILLQDSCRLCLQQQGKYDVFQMHNLSEDIYTWTSVEIKSDDGLPQNICEQCFKIINSVRVLRKLALYNESRLRTFLLNNENTEEDKNFIDGSVTRTDSVTIGQRYNTEVLILNNIDLLNQIRNSDNREQLWAHNDQHVNLEIIEDEIQLDDDGGIEIDDNYLSVNDSVQEHLPPSRGLAVRRDLFSTDANEPQFSNETNERSPDDEFILSVDTPGENHVRAEINEFHKCTICNKVCQNKKKRYHHQSVDNRPFACPVPLCNKRFATRVAVEIHVRVHTGEKPYECEICLKRFTQRCSLKSHKEKMHSNLEI